MSTKEIDAVSRIAAQVRDNTMLVTEDGLWAAFEDALGESDMPYERYLYLSSFLGFFQSASNN